MTVVLGEDQGLGHRGAAWEQGGAVDLLEVLDDGADLVFGDHVAVELVDVVLEVIFHLSQPLGPGETVSDLQPGALVDFAALSADLGADLIDVEVHVDVVRHGLLVGVLVDEVLLEVADGLL